MKVLFFLVGLTVVSCTPTPSPPGSAVLSALADQSRRGALVAEVPGEPVGGISLIAEEEGLSLYVSVYDGPDRRIWKRARSSDGVQFDEAVRVTAPAERADLLDVVRIGDLYRALWIDAGSRLHASSSPDGLTFVDDGIVEVGDGSSIPFGARLIAGAENGFHLYFTEDRSTGCTDTFCLRAAIVHGASSNLQEFSTIEAVAEDPPQADTCAGCGTDYWFLGGVVRPAATVCSSDGPILLALRNLAEATWVAIALESDGLTTSASLPLADVEPVVRVGMSQTAVFADGTIAIYSATCANSCNSPPVTAIRLDVVAAPANAELGCTP